MTSMDVMPHHATIHTYAHVHRKNDVALHGVLAHTHLYVVTHVCVCGLAWAERPLLNSRAFFSFFPCNLLFSSEASIITPTYTRMMYGCLYHYTHIPSRTILAKYQSTPVSHTRTDASSRACIHTCACTHTFTSARTHTHTHTQLQLCGSCAPQ